MKFSGNHFVRGAALLAGLFLTATLHAHPLVIWIGGDAGAAGVLRFEFESTTLGGSITGMSINVSKGDGAGKTADAIKAGFDLPPSSYETTIEDKSKGGVTLKKISVNPLPGVPNFTKGAVVTPPASDPRIPSSAVQILSNTPGTSSLELNPLDVGDPLKLIDWNLLVMDQNELVIAQTTLAQMADTTTAATLIQLFATDLTGKGVPVVASGNKLSMATPGNSFFVLSRSEAGSLFASLTNESPEIVPEPAMASLGMMGLAAMMLRRARRRVA